MKIALVILHADSARGGAERYTLDLASSLSERGHAVSILAGSFQDGATAGERVLIPSRGATRAGRYKSFLDALDNELANSQYDIVHAMLPVRKCDVYHPHAGVAIEGFKNAHRQKSGALQQAAAWTGNRMNRRRRRFAAVEHLLLTASCPPVVLCLSNLIQAVVRRHYPMLPADHLIALFNGIDLNRFDPQKRREARKAVRDQFRISDSTTVGLMLAQDFDRKGVAQAIKALAVVPEKNLSLLVGGRPDPSKYQKVAKRLGVEHRVIFAGGVTDPVTFYHAADFFVLPSRFDPCSLVVLEALAMGLPVISTVKNGACEIMTDGVHGSVLSDPDAVEELATALRTMLDPAHRLSMSGACLQLRAKLSQQHHVDCLEGVYRDLRRKGSTALGGLAGQLPT